MASGSSGTPSTLYGSTSVSQSMRLTESHCLSLPFWYSESSRSRPSSYSQLKRAAPAAGTSQVSSGESGPAATPHASSFFPLRVQLPVLFLAGAPFSAAAFSNASRVSGSTIIPAAS